MSATDAPEGIGRADSESGDAGSWRTDVACGSANADVERARPAEAARFEGRSEPVVSSPPPTGDRSLVGHRAEIAQLVEHATENRGVASSILALGNIDSRRSRFIQLQW